MKGPHPERNDPGRWLGGDRRGVSTTIAYVLSLVMATLLIAGLVTSAGGFVEDERQRVVRTELGVIGQQLGDDLSATDRLAAAGTASTVRVESDLPRTVAGDQYRIRVESTATAGTYRLVLSSDTTDVTVEVLFTTRYRPGGPAVETPRTVDGGRLTVVADPGRPIEVTDD